MLAYVSYQAINWPGLNTAMLTCMITAVSTIGSSRQKQLLRLAGTILGGIVMGIGAQVFVLPYIDSIVGFTVLFAVVTGISAWIVTATPRLSFLGIQVALAFYLINLQEFTIESSLVPARDRLVGVLLGLLSMRLVFDRLWVRDALQEMQEQFARNLRLLAELIDQSRKDDRLEAVRRIIQLRDQIDNGFNVVRAQADAVLFEFGPSRERKLAIRDDIRRWQPTLGALLQVQITFLQYLLEQQSMQLPPAFAEAETAFGQDLATIARAMSDEVEGKTPAVAPDIQSAARRLQGEIEQNCTASGVEIPPRLVDMITLTQSLAFIVAPLYADIHATFTSPQQAAINHPQVVAPNAANV